MTPGAETARLRQTELPAMGSREDLPFKPTWSCPICRRAVPEHVTQWFPSSGFRQCLFCKTRTLIPSNVAKSTNGVKLASHWPRRVNPRLHPLGDARGASAQLFSPREHSQPARRAPHLSHPDALAETSLRRKRLSNSPCIRMGGVIADTGMMTHPPAHEQQFCSTPRGFALASRDLDAARMVGSLGLSPRALPLASRTPSHSGRQQPVPMASYNPKLDPKMLQNLLKVHRSR